jgi:transmembrane sensor
MSRQRGDAPAGSGGSGTDRAERALEEAAGWRARLQEPTPEDTAAFEQWVHAHPEHQRAWQSMEATWHSLSRAARPGSRAVLEQMFSDERRIARNWLGAAGLTLVLAIVPVAWLGSGVESPKHLLADHYTAVGERKRVVLADGSELILNTATAVDIDFRSDHRIIHLRAGEIQITVAPDRDRPLDVLTTEGSARALGTRFAARRFDNEGELYLGVTVQESRVQLCQGEGENCVRLGRNQQAHANHGGLGAIENVDADAQAAWVRGQLVVDDQPLAHVLHTLGRQHRGLLQYDEAALTGLKVSGVLPLDDIDWALKALAGSQPIEVRRYTPWIIRVTRKQ